MSKQDRQGVRKLSDIEQKYNLALLESLKGKSQSQDESLSALNQALSQFIVNTNNKFAEMQKSFENLFPVGSIFVTIDNVETPSKYLLGTWKLLAEGTFVLGSDKSANDLPQLLLSETKCYVWVRES